MALTYGFFNSVNGDRVYNADQISGLFEGLITSGVYESVGNKLAVQANAGMTIQVATGRGWFAKRWLNNDAPYLIALAGSDVLLNRYAAIVVRVDRSNSERSVTVVPKYGEYGTTAVKPTMDHNDEVDEYCLAYVYIGAGVSEITQEDIEDTRSNNDLCGWVTGLITQLSTTTLFTQYEAIFNGFMNNEVVQFNEWFEGLQVTLDGDVATKLTNALPTSTTVTLSADGWTADGYVWTQTVSVLGMNSTKSVIAEPDETTAELYESCGVKCYAQSVNQLTFIATAKPTGDVMAKLVYMGV